MRLLQPGSTYAALRADFRHAVPKQFNIGVDAADKHGGDPAKTALIYEDETGTVRSFSFAELARLSNRLANALRALGAARGDRVAILLGQRPETLIAHLAIYKLGAIALPLFTLFGPDALHYRLENSGASFLITDGANVDKVTAIKDGLPALATIVVTEPEGDAGDHEFWALLARGDERFEAVKTAADDPAMVLYTSGTTGPPKGALHGHRVVFGHYPGIEFTHDFFPQPGDLFWTPADWAWAGGLLDVLLPSLHYGVPVLAHRAAKFDPEKAFDLIRRHKVRNMFLPPTAMKLMRQVARPESRFALDVRTVGSGGESLGAELIDWGRSVFGLTINEFWGQTEANLLAGNSAVVHEVRPGSMGLAVPGHDVAVIDEAGNPAAPGELGQFAARRPDPVFLLEYWRNPEATAEKYLGDWLLTGDVGTRDEDGYFWFAGRDDDVIASAGYRIGPSEIEDCLIRHPAIAMAAVIGAPDPVRGQIVKAFVVRKAGAVADNLDEATLTADIQDFVRTRLAAHQYPRAIAFVDDLPLTATGKIRRKELREAEYAKENAAKDGRAGGDGL